MKSLLINTFFALYFFIGMDIIYWQVHENDKPAVNYHYKVGGGTGYATSCFDAPKTKICEYGGYMIEVDTYWEV
jgi:hypothetical protein